VKSLLAVVILILVAATAAYFCTFTVSEREFAILAEFGKPIKTIREPGIVFKYPYQNVIRIDKRYHVIKSQPIELLLKDKNPIVVVCYTCWRVSDPDLFLRSLVTADNAKLKLSDMLNSQLGSVLGDYNLDDALIEEMSQFIESAPAITAVAEAAPSEKLPIVLGYSAGVVKFWSTNT